MDVDWGGEHMKKRLVFNFYVTSDWYDNEINRFHLRCLSKYAYIFDELVFVISLDDINDTALIRSVEHQLLELHTRGRISFKIHQNDKTCEGDTMHTEVVQKLGDDVLVFFAHNKGCTNITNQHNEVATSGIDRNVVYAWVYALYYFALEYSDVIDTLLIGKSAYCYGALLTSTNDSVTKYHWYYSGAFFWINSPSLYDYIKRSNIELPHCSHRAYAEEFLGHVIPMNERVRSLSDVYLVGEGINYYLYVDDYIKTIYGEEEYNKFHFSLNNLM